MNKETESSKAIYHLESTMKKVSATGTPSKADIETFCTWAKENHDLVKQPLFSKLATLTTILSAENDITPANRRQLCRICRDLTGR